MDNLRLFIEKELNFSFDQEWIYFIMNVLYQRLEQVLNHFQMNDDLENIELNKLVLSKSDDISVIKSNCLLNLNLYRESYLISSELKLSSSGYNIDGLIS